MELRERLQGHQTTAGTEIVPDSFGELKDRIHMAVILSLIHI